MLERLVSGGQTGADRAALDVALAHGFPHGGWCPRGRAAEDGALAARYALRETPGTDYLQRTEWNVRDTDGTVVFTLAARASGGSLSTLRIARRLGRPCLHLTRGAPGDPARRLAAFVTRHAIQTLNVAGSREGKEPGVGAWVAAVLERTFFGAAGDHRPATALRSSRLPAAKMGTDLFSAEAGGDSTESGR